MKTISLKEAIELVPDSATIMIGGFMGVGTPEAIIDELVRQKRKISSSSPTTLQRRESESASSSAPASRVAMS
jgi:acyl CoA:acetate/3-ketoacid CoA transferase